MQACTCKCVCTHVTHAWLQHRQGWSSSRGWWCLGDAGLLTGLGMLAGTFHLPQQVFFGCSGNFWGISWAGVRSHGGREDAVGIMCTHGHIPPTWLGCLSSTAPLALLWLLHGAGRAMGQALIPPLQPTHGWMDGMGSVAMQKNPLAQLGCRVGDSNTVCTGRDGTKNSTGWKGPSRPQDTSSYSYPDPSSHGVSYPHVALGLTVVL